jgi:hypothetical protein
MSSYNHATVPTQFVDAGKIRFAYRRWGKKSGVPLVCNIHLDGVLDDWDPAVTDGFAAEREIIIFDNAGVGSSTGEVPTTFAEMAKNAILFIHALGIEHGDAMTDLTPEAKSVIAGTYDPPETIWLPMLFRSTPVRHAAGVAFLGSSSSRCHFRMGPAAGRAL